MRVLIDSNVLISASLYKNGIPDLAFSKATISPNQGVICDQNIDEMRRVYYRKFPHKLDLLEEFLANALPVLEIIQIPKRKLVVEDKIRDIADRPILRAALKAKSGHHTYGR